MLKPQMPNIPGVGAMADTLDFVKNLWGSMSVPGMSIPGMVVPTLSVDELDKKIADLKAVEAWLNVNVSMLRGTIQALEVQRGTIATLKSMGATLANAVKQPGANETTVLAAAPFASAFFSMAGAEAPRAEAKPEVKPAPQPTLPAKDEPAATAAAAAAAGAMTNPVLWWNMLQDQFKTAVATAMSPEALHNASAMAQDAAAKMSAASMRPAAELSKAMSEGLAKAAPATAPQQDNNQEQSTPAGKRAPAKKASKPKSSKEDD